MYEPKSRSSFLVALLLGFGGLALFMCVRHFYALPVREQHRRMMANLEHGFQTNGGIRASNGSWSFPATPPDQVPSFRKMREANKIAVELENRADLIIETLGGPGDELITIHRPEGLMPLSKERIKLRDLELKLPAVPKTNSLAIIEAPAYGFPTRNMTNFTNIIKALERSGFGSVEIVVYGWGQKFVVPKEAVPR